MTLVVIVVLDVVTRAVLVASVGSTVFVLFTMPGDPTARARNVIGGHALCGLVGSLSMFVPIAAELAPLRWSLAVGVAIFVMVTTDTEHAPAAGTALAMAISGWNSETYVRLLLTVGGVWLGARALRPWMRDLL